MIVAFVLLLVANQRWVIALTSNLVNVVSVAARIGSQRWRHPN